MSSVIIAGNTSGTITLDAPNVAGTTTLTLPTTSGTVLASGTAVTVAQGGTGLATLTANNVILGNGTSAVQVVAPSTNGNVLTSNGTTWTSAAPPSSTPTTAQVLTATAGATVGDVGTYAFLAQPTTTSTTFIAGTNYAGSGLRYAGLLCGGSGWGAASTSAAYGGFSGSAPSGTWKAMGTYTGTSNDTRGTIFLRVS